MWECPSCGALFSEKKPGLAAHVKAELRKCGKTYITGDLQLNLLRLRAALTERLLGLRKHKATRNGGRYPKRESEVEE